MLTTQPDQAINNTPPMPGDTPRPSVDQEEIDEKKRKPLFIILGSLLSCVMIFMLWYIFFGGNTNKALQNIEQGIVHQAVTPTLAPATTVSGNVTFEGYAPPESYIAITERVQGRTDFRDVVSGLIPGKETQWVWKDATHGTNYEIKALLKIRGKEIQESSLTTISAPATGVNLHIVSEQKPTQPTTATISGTVHLDGYIPSGSTVIVQSRPTGKGNFQTVVSGLPAQDNMTWSWNNAIAGKTYDLELQLQNASGVPISTQIAKIITAPSFELLFDVSSTAQPPAPAITGLSGTITINGDIPANSYITLGERPTGTANFTQVASQLAATNGAGWKWSNAQEGQEYDVQAYMWVNGKPYAQSNILSLTAPSLNNLLLINAQQQIGAPSGDTLSVACNGAQNGQFQATINYNTKTNIQNAQQYRVLVTQASNGNQIINTTLTPGNPNQSQSLTTAYQFTPGVTYYTQYAYSTNSSTFSPLSPSIQFSCQ